MKISLKVNIFSLYLNVIIFLISIKLLFSYLAVRLSYFQSDLTPNSEQFNFLGLPEDFSNKIEYVLIPLLTFFVIQYRKYSKIAVNIITLSFVMYFLNFITSIINNVSIIDSLNFSLKIFTPLYFFSALIIYHNATQKSLKPLLKKSIIFCLALTFIGILFFNPTFNRLKNYLPVYFDSIHTHNYILASVFIGISYLLYRQQQKILMVAFLIVSFLFLYLGYDIRTVLILYLMYAITMLFLVSDLFKVLLIKLFIFIPLLILLGFLIASDLDLIEISSGRTAMYSDKIDQLASYSFSEWIFGKGYGSDLILTDVWWWEKKGAHSDLITFLVENGVIYLLMFIYLHILLIKSQKRLNLIIMIVVLGSLFSSTISNGIMVRPTAAYIFCLTLAYIYVDIANQKNNITKNV